MIPCPAMGGATGPWVSTGLCIAEKSALAKEAIAARPANDYGIDA